MDVRGKLLTQMVIHILNELSEEVVDAVTIMTWKRHLHRLLNRWVLDGYEQSAGK